MSIIRRFMRFFFYLLYHPFAWSYDFVAWAVSLGRWNDWGQSVLPYIKGTRVLELGHGPGHLQRILLSRGLLLVGLDESRQMGYLTKKRLSKHDYAQFSIIRGLGQDLPFQDKTFESIIATFPTEYIFEERTLSEVRRTLTNEGRLIVLPAAWVIGRGPLDTFAAWLFHITGQAPYDLSEASINRFVEPFLAAGFRVETKQLEVKSSLVLIVLAEK